jgi:hypothetical protein
MTRSAHRSRVARLLGLGLVLVALSLPVAGQPKYGVTVIADKATDFTKVKSYTWQSGWDANDRKVHDAIVAAVDKELKALGLDKKTAAPSDVIVKYASLRRIDVVTDMKSEANTPRQQIDVGSLVVVFLNPTSMKEVLRLRVDKPIEIAPDQAVATVNAAVADLFAKYPTRVAK